MKKTKNQIFENIINSYAHCVTKSSSSSSVIETRYRKHYMINLLYLETSLRQFIFFVEKQNLEKKRLIFVFDEEICSLFKDFLSSSPHFYTTDPKKALTLCSKPLYSDRIGGIVFLGSFNDIEHVSSVKKPLFFFVPNLIANSDLNIIVNTRYHSSLFLLKNLIVQVLNTLTTKHEI